ncbi:MAG: tellurite resistance protein TerB [Prevotella sp.]|nr:tellurite resistance protein TerB [Prevotella sp.]
MDFNRDELMAIAKIANAMIAADGKVEENEMSSWTLEMERFGIAEAEFRTLYEQSEELDFVNALSVISNFDEERKRYVGAFLGTLMAIDGDIDDAELKLWQLVSTFCDLPTMSLGEALAYMAEL